MTMYLVTQVSGKEELYANKEHAWSSFINYCKEYYESCIQYKYFKTCTPFNKDSLAASFEKTNFATYKNEAMDHDCLIQIQAIEVIE